MHQHVDVRLGDRIGIERRIAGVIVAAPPDLAVDREVGDVDAYVIEEARRNLGAKAPDRISVLETLLLRMKRAGAQRIDLALEASLSLPAKDRPVLAATIHQACDALVTGDRTHFGALYGRTIHGVAIHRQRQACSGQE